MKQYFHCWDIWAFESGVGKWRGAFDGNERSARAALTSCISLLRASILAYIATHGHGAIFELLATV